MSVGVLETEMSGSWGIYPAIQKLFGEEWLNNPKNRASHPLFQVCDETDYLASLNKYLLSLELQNSMGFTKRTKDQLKNATQFFDIYYELEIAYFLIRHELRPKLHEKIGGIETDIFLEKHKLVVEIKHLRIPNKVDSGSRRLYPKSKCHDIPEAVDLTFINMERMKSYLDKKKFQSVYPNIVCFCPDISAGNCYDVEKLIASCNVPEEVSALALWRCKKTLCLFENPCGKKLEWKSSRLKKFFNFSPKIC